MSAEHGPRVLHTIAGLKRSAGGTSSSVTMMCSELAKAGLGIDLVSQEFESTDDLTVLPEESAVHVRLAPANRLPLLRSVFSPDFRARVERACLESRVDIVHDHGLWLPANHAVSSTCHKLRLPLIVSPHGMLSPDALAHDKMKKALAWRIYQRRDLATAAAFCVTSAQEADDVRASGCDKPIAVIPHGVKIPVLRDGVAPSAEPRIALYVGRIHPIKGLLPLVEAWAVVRPPGWRLVVAGPDEDGYRSVVAAAVQRAGLSGSFEFAGAAYGDAKARLYESASFLVLPSFSENFGMSIAEALACGVPVITTKGTPWPAIAEQRCGWWIDATVPSLVSALREATSLPAAELRSMGRRGRILVQDNFSWANVVSMLVALYVWVLGNGPRPDFVVGSR